MVRRTTVLSFAHDGDCRGPRLPPRRRWSLGDHKPKEYGPKSMATHQRVQWTAVEDEDDDFYLGDYSYRSKSGDHQQRNENQMRRGWTHRRVTVGT